MGASFGKHPLRSVPWVHWPYHRTDNCLRQADSMSEEFGSTRLRTHHKCGLLTPRAPWWLTLRTVSSWPFPRQVRSDRLLGWSTRRPVFSINLFSGTGLTLYLPYSVQTASVSSPQAGRYRLTSTKTVSGSGGSLIAKPLQSMT